MMSILNRRKRVRILLIGFAVDDKIKFSETAHPLLLAFSLLTNGKKILQVSNTQQQQILCFNGLKVISLFWVIMGHRFSIQQARGIINYDDTYSVSN